MSKSLEGLRRKILFLDWRDIKCGFLGWKDSAGNSLTLSSIQETQVELHATPMYVPRGIRLVAQSAQKTEPINAWRGWGRTIFDRGMYRSWFFEINGNSKLGGGSNAMVPNPECVVVCAVESKDGFYWSESNRCQIRLPNQYGFDGVTFFIDEMAPAHQRYKFVYCAYPPGDVSERLWAEYVKREPRYQDERTLRGINHCIYTLTSPDGLTWTPVYEPLMMHPSDTDTTVYFDQHLGKYVMFTRMFRNDRRWIGRAESDDFFHWGPIEPVIWPRLDDPPDYDFYLNSRTDYPGLPEYQLMFPMVWHRFTERSEVRLYSSADGIAWNQVPGGHVIAPGEPGTWDSEFIGCGKDLVPFGTGRIAIPYSGTEYPHKYPRWPAVWDAWKMAWAWWPEDRLCAVKSDIEGEFWTIEMIPVGRNLKLNFRTPRAGEIRVGVVGVDGRSADECDPVHGDSSGTIITWNGNPDIVSPESKPITLHFKLRCAEIFAFEWV